MFGEREEFYRFLTGGYRIEVNQIIFTQGSGSFFRQIVWKFEEKNIAIIETSCVFVGSRIKTIKKPKPDRRCIKVSVWNDPLRSEIATESQWAGGKLCVWIAEVM